MVELELYFEGTRELLEGFTQKLNGRLVGLIDFSGSRVDPGAEKGRW